MEYTVAQVSKKTGVRVRALHYYDSIGLLSPAYIRKNGYRMYGSRELNVLEQILFFRELDFSLSDIKLIRSSPEFSVESALVDQKKLLEIKKKRYERLLDIINEKLKGGGTMSHAQIFGALSDAKTEEYKKEAKKRWGHTDAYKQSAARTKSWTKEEFARAQKESRDITEAVAERMDFGIADAEVQKIIARHHAYIGQFYDVSLDMYRSLGQMYVDDPRFAQTYDSVRKGLAVFMRDAIALYCSNA